MDRKMYNELLRLRQRLKEAGRRTQGRAPLVCSDDALLEIAELCPKKLSDFEGVPGIGKAFIENYGEAFLQVILKYEEVSTEKTVTMTASAVGLSQILCKHRNAVQIEQNLFKAEVAQAAAALFSK